MASPLAEYQPDLCCITAFNFQAIARQQLLPATACWRIVSPHSA